MQDFFPSLSATPSLNPIGHGAALKQPCNNHWLLNVSSLITLTYQYLRQAGPAHTPADDYRDREKGRG